MPIPYLKSPSGRKNSESMMIWVWNTLRRNLVENELKIMICEIHKKK